MVQGYRFLPHLSALIYQKPGAMQREARKREQWLECHKPDRFEESEDDWFVECEVSIRQDFVSHQLVSGNTNKRVMNEELRMMNIYSG